MSKKHEKMFGVLNYFEHFLAFVSTVSGYIIKKYKSIIKKKRENKIKQCCQQKLS